MTTAKCLDCGNEGDAEDGWFVTMNDDGNTRCTKCGSYQTVYTDDVDCDHEIEWEWYNALPDGHKMAVTGECPKCDHTFERHYEYTETYRTN